MNNKVKTVSIISAGLALFFLAKLYAVLAPAMRGANITLKQVQGQNILLCIEHGKENSIPRWSHDIENGPIFTNSSDYFNWLKADSDAMSLQKVSALKTSRAHTDFFLLRGREFSEENNMWTVIKNISASAPDNLIVLATRNVDPTSLPQHLTSTNRSKRIRLLYQDDPLFRNGIILIRKDGMIWKGKHSPNYEEVCGSVPFDLTTNLVNGMPVKYLTPTGEVTPRNE